MSTLEPNFDLYNDFIAELCSDNDRAAVIVGAARLDAILLELLTKALQPPMSKTDELLNNNGPIATFSSRIDLLYRLGIISADMARHLHLIRKIRNAFAHEFTNKDLSNPPHFNRVQELVQPFIPSEAFQRVRVQFSRTNLPPACTDFRCVIGILAYWLDALSLRTHRVQPYATWSLPWQEDTLRSQPR